LIRRVTFDLTGLPPAPPEIDAFLADKSKNAYEKVVDRLSASPHYGERMALEWLDAARFADTHGYHIDSGRDMTRWREWVIDASIKTSASINSRSNRLPAIFCRTRPSNKNRQRIQSQHMINFVSGAIPKSISRKHHRPREHHGTVWLGLTSAAPMPRSQIRSDHAEGIYQLFAFYHNVPENGLDGQKGNASAGVKDTTHAQETEIAAAKARIAELESTAKSQAAEAKVEFTEWEAAKPANAPKNKELSDAKSKLAESRKKSRQRWSCRNWKNRARHHAHARPVRQKGRESHRRRSRQSPPLPAARPPIARSAKWLVDPAKSAAGACWRSSLLANVLPASASCALPRISARKASVPSTLICSTGSPPNLSNPAGHPRDATPHVTSATYRQVSATNPKLLAKDPKTPPRARSPLRMPIEFIRDQSLAVSGLLNERNRRQSVSPYQPKGIWRIWRRARIMRIQRADLFSKHGRDLYRRTMYTFWKRTAPRAHAWSPSMLPTAKHAACGAP